MFALTAVVLSRRLLDSSVAIEAGRTFEDMARRSARRDRRWPRWHDQENFEASKSLFSGSKS
jgi:hypothetical protein